VIAGTSVGRRTRSFAAIAAAVIALGCGSEQGGEPGALGGVASCVDASQALGDRLFAAQTSHSSCAHDTDCTSLRYLVVRDGAPCIDHGCRLAVSSAGAGALSEFLATDHDLTALCGYLRDHECRRVVADCLASEPACEQQRCTMRRAE